MPKGPSSEEMCEFISHRIPGQYHSSSKYRNISLTVNLFASVHSMHLDIKFTDGFYSWNQIQILSSDTLKGLKKFFGEGGGGSYLD